MTDIAEFMKEMERVRNLMSGPLVEPKPDVALIFTNRSFLIPQQEMWLEKVKAQIQNSQNQIGLSQTFTSKIQSSGKVDLVAKNRVNLSDLAKNPGKVLKGKFLLCRTICPPFKMTALSTVVEDPEGKLAVRMSLYNFVAEVSNCSLEKALSYLPVGTILAIKNPWFKTTADGGLSLRCDNPGEVIVVDEEALLKLFPDKLQWKGEIPVAYRPKQIRSAAAAPAPAALELRNVGNKHFVAKRFQEAISTYTKALKLENLEALEIDLMANRSAAYLEIEKYTLALKDSEEVLRKKNGNHIKCIVRKTKALWGLGDYEKALSFLMQNKKLEMSSGDKKYIDEMMAKADAFLRQNKFGDYPWKTIEGYLKKSNKENLDLAEFQLGSLTVKKSGEKGRGIFTTRNIRTGELIMATKAFQSVSLENRQSVLVSLNFETKLINDDSQVQLVANIARFLNVNPEKGEQFYKLYAGPELKFLDPATDDCSIVDMKRIDEICNFNAFGSGSALKIEEKRSSGIWIQPSFINHSCFDCNCSWFIAGDFHFVRAFKDIQAGDEILIPYQQPSMPYEERVKALNKYGFTCTCTLCEWDKKDSVEIKEERAKLIKNIQALKDPAIEFIPILIEIDTALKKLEKSRENCSKLNIMLGPHLHQLGFWFFEQGDFMKSAEITEKGFNLMNGTPLDREAVDCCMDMIAALPNAGAGQKQKVKEWVLTLKKITPLVYGSIDVLEVTGEYLLAYLKENGITLT